MTNKDLQEAEKRIRADAKTAEWHLRQDIGHAGNELRNSLHDDMRRAGDELRKSANDAEHDLRMQMHQEGIELRKLMLEMRESILHTSRRCNELNKRLDELSEEHQSKLAVVNDDIKTLIAHRFEEDKPERPKKPRKRDDDNKTISFRRDAAGKVTHIDVVKDEDE